jgi:hypothetical protein
MKQKTILKLQKEFRDAIHELGIQGFRVSSSEVRGDDVVMLGAHMTMHYPEDMYLTNHTRKALIHLVSKYYQKPISVHDHKNSVTILSWLKEPNRRVHEIVFVFEKGLANDRLVD